MSKIISELHQLFDLPTIAFSLLMAKGSKPSLSKRCNACSFATQKRKREDTYSMKRIVPRCACTNGSQRSRAGSLFVQPIHHVTSDESSLVEHKRRRMSFALYLLHSTNDSFLSEELTRAVMIAQSAFTETYRS